MQGGWENERIAELSRDPALAAKILRHGEDESKHGRLFAAFLRRRGLEPGDFIERTLKRYAMAEIRTARDVSLAFGARAIYVYERLWGWRRIVRLAPPERPNALGAAQPAG